MISRLSEKGLLIPSILALVGLLILISLGNWQLRRKAWKAELIARVESRLNAAPLGFQDLAARAEGGGDIEYLPVRLSGRWLNSSEIHYFLPLGSEVGWHIISPLEVEGGGIVFVDRGFVPNRFKEPFTRSSSFKEGQVNVTGLARRFETPGLFTPTNDVISNQWYWRDGSAFYKTLKGYDGPQFLFMVDAKDNTGDGKWPKAGVTRVKFQDKHLGYALTWYGLALTLIGVFCVFAFQRLRR